MRRRATDTLLADPVEDGVTDCETILVPPDPPEA